MKLNEFLIESKKMADDVPNILDMYDISYESADMPEFSNVVEDFGTFKEALNTVIVCFIRTDKQQDTATCQLITQMKFSYINAVRKIMKYTPPMKDPSLWLNAHIRDDNLSHIQKSQISKFFPTFWEEVKKFKDVHFYGGKFSGGRYVIWVVKVPKDNTRIDKLIQTKKIEDEIKRSAIKRNINNHKRQTSN